MPLTSPPSPLAQVAPMVRDEDNYDEDVDDDVELLHRVADRQARVRLEPFHTYAVFASDRELCCLRF